MPNMELTPAQVQRDLDALPQGYKTRDVDGLIRRYVSRRADASPLRPYILERQQFHRIYYYVNLQQIKSVEERMAFLDRNLLFSDWWHTDQLIRYVAALEFETALRYAAGYVRAADPFVRRWGYVLFISRLCRGHAADILPLLHDDDAYYVQMAEAWLLAELAVYEPEAVYAYLAAGKLSYAISGKAIQKLCDSFRIPDVWKQRCRALRPQLRRMEAEE